MSILLTGGEGTPLKDILKELNRDFDTIMVRCLWEKDDDLIGYCSYINGELKSLDGDSYSLNDLYIKWEVSKDSNGDDYLCVWDKGYSFEEAKELEKETDWANREVYLACKKQDINPYACECYKSALKAYKCLMEDGHSGFSWGKTVYILNRLCANLPLTSITDEDFFIPNTLEPLGEEYLKKKNLKSSYQCPRRSSLFREERLDGTVYYTDINRVVGVDMKDNEFEYHSGIVVDIVDEYFPIKMPYYPSDENYRVYTETFLVDKEMGDFDTRAIYSILPPDNGEPSESREVSVFKFFKEIKDGDMVWTDGYSYQPTKWVEITKEEFEERKKNQVAWLVRERGE